MTVTKTDSCAARAAATGRSGGPAGEKERFRHGAHQAGNCSARRRRWGKESGATQCPLQPQAAGVSRSRSSRAGSRFHVVGVLVHDRDDHLPGDRLLALFPAVVVGRHRDRLVADAGFARERHLGDRRHVDHVGAQEPEHVRFGPGRKRGPSIVTTVPCRWCLSFSATATPRGGRAVPRRTGRPSACGPPSCRGT